VLYVTAICYAGHRLSKSGCSAFRLDPWIPHLTVLQHLGLRGRVMSRHGSFILWGIGVHPLPRTRCVAFAMTHSHHPKNMHAPSVVETVRGSHVLASHVLGLPGRQRAGKGQVKEWSSNGHRTVKKLSVKKPSNFRQTFAKSTNGKE